MKNLFFLVNFFLSALCVTDVLVAQNSPNVISLTEQNRGQTITVPLHAKIFILLGDPDGGEANGRQWNLADSHSGTVTKQYDTRFCHLNPYRNTDLESLDGTTHQIIKEENGFDIIFNANDRDEVKGFQREGAEYEHLWCFEATKVGVTNLSFNLNAEPMHLFIKPVSVNILVNDDSSDVSSSLKKNEVPASTVISLTEDNDGSAVTIPADGKILMLLPEETDSSLWTYSLEGVDGSSSVLQEEQSMVFSHGQSFGLAGYWGEPGHCGPMVERIWSFKSVAPGKTTMVFHLQRTPLFLSQLSSFYPVAPGYPVPPFAKEVTVTVTSL